MPIQYLWTIRYCLILRTGDGLSALSFACRDRIRPTVEAETTYGIGEDMLAIQTPGVGGDFEAIECGFPIRMPKRYV